MLRQIQKRRSLHDKHREQRRDLTLNMPFIIAYQGDPAMGNYFYCNDLHIHKLISPETEGPFARLQRYLNKGIASIFMEEGKILVKEAC